MVRRGQTGPASAASPPINPDDLSPVRSQAEATEGQAERHGGERHRPSAEAAGSADIAGWEAAQIVWSRGAGCGGRATGKRTQRR